MSTLRIAPMRWLLLTLLLTLLASQWAAGQTPSPRGRTPAESQNFLVPQFGHGTDNFGNVFSTEINLLNLSTSAAGVTISTFDDSGEAVNLLREDVAPQTPPTSVTERTLEVDGKGTGRQESLNLAPTSALALGYALITSTEPIGVEIIFAIETVDGQITTTNLRVGPTIASASFLARVERGGNTGLALLNPAGNAAVTVNLDFIGPSGVTLDSAEVTIEPGEKRSQFATELFDQVPAGTFGSVDLRVSGEAAIAVLPLRQDGVELTTQELFPERPSP